MRTMTLLLGMTLVVGACGDGSSASTTAVSTTAVPATAPTTTTTTAATTTTTAATTTTTAATSTTAEPALEIEVIVHQNGIEVIVDGISVDPGARVAVDLGTKIRLIASGEVEDEVHVHTYDLFVPVEPGVENEIEFVADIPGIVEVELEAAHTEVFELEVS